MTPKEIQAALCALRAHVGPNADVTFTIEDREHRAPIYAAIYAFGVGSHERDGFLSLHAETVEDALAQLRSQWEAHRLQFEGKTINRMALAIIEITAANGTCSDAALRTAKFSERDIATLGAQACAAANIMAEKGPFEIVTAGRSNGAPKHVDPVARVQ